MSEYPQSSEFFQTLSKILLRCWIMGFLFVTFWFGLFMLAGNFVYQLHGAIFGLVEHELNVIFYCGMGLFKLSVILFFFIPWLSIRFVCQNEYRHQSVPEKTDSMT